MPRATITISASLNRRLTALCIKKNFVKGEEYYKVPDYATGISFLLDKNEIKKKNPKKRKRKS